MLVKNKLKTYDVILRDIFKYWDFFQQAKMKVPPLVFYRMLSMKFKLIINEDRAKLILDMFSWSNIPDPMKNRFYSMPFVPFKL